MTAFLKMHGLGNDFVVFDGRKAHFALDSATARALSDRRFGIGCDQVIVLLQAREADAAMRIFNANGGEVESCGNAARCVARLLMEEKDCDRIALQTPGGTVLCSDAGSGQVTVDMGEAHLDWDRIPLARPADTDNFAIEVGGETFHVAAVNVGNPHCIVFEGNADTSPVEVLGPRIEMHAMFPKRTNVEFVTVRDRSHLRMRVWERGVGITSACGTGACASAVAAHRRGLSERKVEVLLDGGPLAVEWREADSHVLMTGPTALAFKGDVDLRDFAQ